MEKMYWQYSSAKTGWQNFYLAILMYVHTYIKGFTWFKLANNNSRDRWGSNSYGFLLPLCNCVDIWNLILKSQESDPLLTRSITGTKNGLSVTMSNARDTQVKKMYGLKAFEKSIFIKKRDVIYHND